MPFVIGLTGLASSGKGTVSNYLVKKYNFVKLVFSDILKEEAEKRGLLKTKNIEEQKYILSKLGEKLRKETGKWDILAEKLIEKIKSKNFEKVVIDGFRAIEEVKLFRKNFKDFYLIFIDVDENVRFSRRKLEDQKTDIKDFKARDRENIENLGLGKVIELANFKVDNNTGLENLYNQVDNVLKQINH